MTTPHDGLTFPPKKPRWRRWLAMAGLLFSALYWEYGRYTFEIVEIDDGTAPGNGREILARYVDGERILVKSFLPAETNGGVGVMLVEPHRTFKTTIAYSPYREVSRGAGALVLKGEFEFLRRRCTAVVRWRSGQASFEGCPAFHNVDSL